MMKDDSVYHKSKKILLLVITLLFLGLWLAYMIWAAGIGRRTVLATSTPEWITYIAVGSIVGGIFAARTAYYHSEGKSLKRIIDSFFLGSALV